VKKKKKISARKLIKSLRNRAKKLWRQRVLERWNNKCVICGSTKLPNCHHIVPKETFILLRYDPINGIVLCPKHHKFNKFSAHKNPLWFVSMLVKLMKAHELEHLLTTMEKIVPFEYKLGVNEYIQIIDNLNKESKDGKKIS